LFKLGLRYVWRQRWQCLLLALGFSVVTGFFGAYALYSDQLVNATQQRMVSTLTKQQTSLTLHSAQPFKPDTETIIKNALGDLFSRSMRFSRAVGPDEAPTLGKICSYDYAQGEPLTVNTPLAYTTADHCYIVYSFSPLEDVFSLKEGRWPQVLGSPKASAASDTPRIMDEVQIEAVISTANAEQTGLQVGDRLVLGNRFDQTATVEIVGLVDPAIDPDDVFWYGNGVTLTGEWTQFGDDIRFDIGLIMREDAFAAWIPTITPSYFFAWWYEVDPHSITSAHLNTLDTSLYRAEREIRSTQPDIKITGGLKIITSNFDTEIAQYDATVRTAAAAVGACLIGLLTIMAVVIFTADRKTWSLLVMRGAKRFQIVRIMLLEIVIAGIAGTGLGIFWAWGLVELFSPTELPPPSGIKPHVLLTSLTGAGVTCLVLALAVSWMSRRIRRPTAPPMVNRPARPIWSRYYLDVALLVVGVALFVRLIHLAAGDVGTGIRDFLLDPASLIQRLAGTQNARGIGLNDPFNLVGPLLILGGSALLWLRLFPILMALPVWAFGKRPRLLVPLALWHTVRAPSRHTTFALSLIVASALMTASAALATTIDSAAWRAAYHEVGADARLTVDPTAGASTWTAVPGVSAAVPVIRLDDTARNTALLGVEPVALQAAFPDLDAAFSQLTLSAELLPGLLLPDNAVSLTAETLSELDPDDPGHISFEAILADARGVITHVSMLELEGSTADRATISAELPSSQYPPWHVLGFRISSTYQKRHIMYLDDVSTIDANGQRIILEDFESDRADHWTAGSDQTTAPLLTEHSSDGVIHGHGSLRLDVLVKFDSFADLRPVLMVSGSQPTEVPVVVSQAYVDQEQHRTRNSPRLRIGDRDIVSFRLSEEQFLLSYRIVGIVQDFPTMATDAAFIVAPLDAFRFLLNTSIPGSVNYDVNQVWLQYRNGHISGPDISEDQLRQELAALPGVTEVTYAEDQYHAMRSWPTLIAVPGLLRLGSIAAIAASTLLLIVCTVREFSSHARHVTTLHTLGWSRTNARGVLVVQLTILAVVTILVGVGLGLLLLYLLLPFLASLGNEVLSLPILGITYLPTVTNISLLL
jgi:hypothetical protein